MIATPGGTRCCSGGCRYRAFHRFLAGGRSSTSVLETGYRPGSRAYKARGVHTSWTTHIIARFRRAANSWPRPATAVWSSIDSLREKAAVRSREVGSFVKHFLVRARGKTKGQGSHWEST